MSAAAVRDGAAELAYSLVQADKTVVTGETAYIPESSCSKFGLTAVSDVYSRADGSEYVQAKGAGTPTGPVNACTYSGTSKTTDWTQLQEWWAPADFCSDPNYKYAKYRAVRKATRDDGLLVSSTIYDKSYYCGTSRGHGGCAETPVTCPNPPTGSMIQQWTAEEGW